MAKISPTSIKYSIIADFVAEGPFQKPDVIGALFGQTEGLLGAEMELRELQKEGKIGRIEVDLVTEGGKTTGEITIPSALDKTETTIIAAALETIDKIGPTDAKITIREIEDVRGSKRDYIMERAKALLAGIKNEGMDSTEMETELRESSRIAKATDYGEEKLAAGPDVDSSNEVIVVEGRADVINMLKYGIKNVIGMQGTRFPKTITKLGETKELTLFVDGDRGGKLIARNVCDNAKIVYIAVAPDGKEVEELAGKELLQALRKKLKASDYFRMTSSEAPRRFEREPRHFERRDSKPSYEEEAPVTVERRKLNDDDISKLREIASEIKGKNVLVLNENLEVFQNIPASRLNSLVTRDAFVLMTSAATGSIVQNAENLKARAVAAKTFTKIPDTTIELISL
jgi:DNA primase